MSSCSRGLGRADVDRKLDVVADPAEVAKAYLEPNGELTVLKKNN